MVHATADSGGSSEGDDKTYSLEYKSHRKKRIQLYNNLILSWTLETPSPKERWLHLKKKKKENLSQETTYAQISAKKQNIIDNQDNMPNPKITNLLVMDGSENS